MIRSLALLLVASLLTGAAPRVRGGNTDGTGVSNGRVRSVPPTSLAAGAVTPALPTGPIIALRASDLSGSNGDLITSWTNGGTIAAFTQADGVKKPLLKKNASEQAVSFDGVFDLVTSASSAAATGFMHSTGVFDLVVVLRRTAPTTGFERRILGNCEGQQGLALLFSTTEGKYWIIMGNGSGLITNLVTTTASAPMGEPVKLLVRGDGTQVRVSADFSTFEDQAFGAALGTGDAFYDFSVGGSNPSQTTPRTLAADVYMVLLYDRNLSAGELTAVQANIVAEVGSGI